MSPTLSAELLETLTLLMQQSDLVDCPYPLLSALQEASAAELARLRTVLQLTRAAAQPANDQIRLQQRRSYLHGNAELELSDPGHVAIRLAGDVIALSPREAEALIDLAPLLTDPTVVSALYQTIARQTDRP